MASYEHIHRPGRCSGNRYLAWLAGLAIACPQQLGEALLGLGLSVNQANLAWPLLHPGDEADQVGLVRVRRVATNRIDAGADVDALAVEVDVPAFRAVSLNVPAGVPLP